MNREDWLSLRDNIRQRVQDLADKFRRVTVEEMRWNRWLFWTVMGLAAMPVLALGCLVFIAGGLVAYVMLVVIT